MNAINSDLQSKLQGVSDAYADYQKDPGKDHDAKRFDALKSAYDEAKGQTDKGEGGEELAHVRDDLANEMTALKEPNSSANAQAFQGQMNKDLKAAGADPSKSGFADAGAGTTMANKRAGNLSNITEQAAMLKQSLDLNGDPKTLGAQAGQIYNQAVDRLKSGKGDDGKDLTDAQKSALTDLRNRTNDIRNSATDPDDHSYSAQGSSHKIDAAIGSLVGAAPRASSAT